MFKYQGITILEFLLSLFLGSLLITFCFDLYLLVKKNMLAAEAFYEQSLAEQMAKSIIGTKIRQAGFTPCLPLGQLKMPAEQRLSAIEGAEKKAQFIQVSRMDGHFETLTEALNNVELLLPRTSIKPYKVGEKILISDCKHAEIKTIAAITPFQGKQRLRFTQAFFFEYENPFYLGRWIQEKFFIKKNRHNKMALFYKYHHTEEWTEGIQSIDAELKDERLKAVLSLTLEFVRKEKRIFTFILRNV